MEAAGKGRSRTGAASTRYGEYRLSYTRLHICTRTRKFPAACGYLPASGHQATAPFAGTIKADGQHLMLGTDNLDLHIHGLECPFETGAAVDAADSLGMIAGAEGSVGGLRLQFAATPI